MGHWARESVFYHIYPLGLCGAPERNHLGAPPVPRLEQLYGWIDHLCALGVNALYLGPVFESTAHGYDTADYYRVDRRLGDSETLAGVVRACHERGIRVILDGVFNHVGRDFWAFRDLLARRQASPYRDWFDGLTFEGQSPYGDPFAYEGWAGHYDLVKLNLHHPEVKEHLLQAVEMWIRSFEIDGLRLDTTDCLEPSFLRDLSALCRAQRADFWLLGEVVLGDYRQWAQPEMLDSITNYECYKGLYSSHVDANYYEIAYALNRQFGTEGIYAHLPLYNFCDNHDVHRVASSLTDPAHLYPLYCLLMTMPGVPSIYYGSEWGIEGRKDRGSDRALRPHLNLAHMAQAGPHPALAQAIARLTGVRHRSRALQYGSYRELSVEHELLSFARQVDDECVVVAVNASDRPASLEVEVPVRHGDRLVDLLNPGESFVLREGQAEIEAIWPHWARIMAVC